MENYNEFMTRINSFEKSETYFGDGYVNTNPSLRAKVGNENRFNPFFGDTVVFDLDEKVKSVLSDYTDKLYASASECFCERLKPDTLHMTLHDLSNSPDLNTVAAEVFINQLKAVKLREGIENLTIHMKSKYVFNMVGTSLVLGLFPVNEDEHKKLMDLYYLFDNIKTLGYPLTPHITLAYFNPDGFERDSAARLEEIIRQLNTNEFEVKLSTNKLYYQKFTDMNSYTNIVKMCKE